MVQQETLKKILCIITVLLLLPVSVKAYNIENIKVENQLLSIKNLAKGSDQITTSEEILGDVDDSDSVAWLLQKILSYIRLIGTSLVLILSAIDFTKSIVISDVEAMKKTQQRLIKRLFAAALLFLIPTITMVLLDLIGIDGSSATAGLK